MDAQGWRSEARAAMAAKDMSWDLEAIVASSSFPCVWLASNDSEERNGNGVSCVWVEACVPAVFIGSQTVWPCMHACMHA